MSLWSIKCVELFPPADHVALEEKSLTQEILEELNDVTSERVKKPSKWALVLNGKGGPRYTLRFLKNSRSQGQT